MSQVSLIRRLCFIFLVSVLETHAESVADALYPIKTLTNTIPGDVNNSSDPLKELSTESVTAAQEEDQDPVESSETIVYNRFEDPQDDDEEDSASDEDPEGPEDHVIPHSEHEEPKDVPTKPKYTAPGEWAKPSKARDVSSEDVPTRLYAQVRRTHTVRRLPRWKAIQDAETEEEKENAARLREVVRNSKVNTVYTEEGYEDSAYDHAGHVRDADYREGYARKLHEQIDAKKKADDGEDNEEGNTAHSKLEKIDTEEFKEFDDDYRDRTTTDYSSYPKVVAENGIQRLQEDLEREVEEIEKGVEINKLEKAEESSDQESLTVSPGDDDYGRKVEKKDRKIEQRTKLKLEPSESQDDSGESLDESQALRSDDVYMQKYSTTDAPGNEDWMSTVRGAYETTTTVPNFGEISSGLSESYRYDVDGNPGTEGIDFQPVGGSHVTPSYSQVFWDYFKARQNQFTTMESPSILESTTSSPSLLQAPSFENLNSPYTFYGGQVTTQFPIMESATFSPQEFVPVQTMDPRYLINNKQSDNQLTGLEGTSLNELWQPVNTRATPTTDNALLSEAYNAKHFDNDHIAPPDSERNLDSKEEFDKNFGNSFLNPPLNSFANRKPRYKVTVRHKPSKPEEPPTSDQGSSTSSPLNDTPNEAPSENTRLKDNYMKVLMHLKNEDRNHYPNSLQKNNLFASKNEDLTYLTRMRPPLPQKETSYYNFDLRGPMENEFSGFETLSRGYPKLRAIPIRQSPPRNVQFNRKRNSMPAGLLPPVPFLGRDYTTFKEASGHVTRGGSPSKLSRGFEPISRIRVKRRERRSTGWESDVVKGVDPLANNGTSNQGEIERAAKNAMIEERNPRRKVTRGLEVGPVPDTSSAMAKQPIEKKSRSHAIDRGGGSRRSLPAGRVAEERESSGVPSDFSKNGGEDESSRGGLENGGETQGDIVQDGVRQETKDHEELRNEAPKIVNDFIDRKINARFNNHENNSPNSEIVEESVKQKRESHEEFLNEAPRTTNDFIDRKINARFNNHENNSPNSEIVEESVKQKRESHEEFLNEAPRITNDFIDRKINARFNNHENKAPHSEIVEESVKQKRESHEELLNEAPKITNDFIDRKINARFNNHENKAPHSEIVEESVKQKRENHEEFLNEAPRTTNDFIDRKINARFNNHENNSPNSEIVEESVKQKRESHEELLNEAPRITNDVVNEEINARFNDTENKSAEVEENEKDVEVEVPDFDYVEELTEEDNSEDEAATDTPEASIDSNKYPFYESLPIPSALKYAIDPRRVPKKTYGKMEFYSSRDAYKHCDEVEPSLKVLPKEEAPVLDGDLKENLPRLTGLGDKLDCYKAKYFDEDPFDNPLFLEKEVEDPVPALDVDTKQFASRIMLFPKQDDDYVVQKSSKSPENHRQPRKPSFTSGRVQKTRRIRYKTYPKARIVTRPRVYRIKGSKVRFVKARRPQKPIRRPVPSASEVSSFYMPYQNQVYEDVMGTIKNLANSYQVEEVTTVPTSDEDTVTDSNVAKKNPSKNSTSIAKKEKDEVITITERPSNVHVNIEGLKPPKVFNRNRMAYNRNRIPQRSRTRKKSSIMRPVRRQKIRIYKRDVNAEGNDDSVNGTREVSSIREKKNTNSEEKSNLNKESSNIRRSRHPASADNSSTDADQKIEKSQRVIYTINDRIRHSKPKEELTRVGKFADEPKVEKNSRRNEPRYNYIRRRRPLITTETPPLNSTDNTDWIEPTSTISDTTSIIDEDRELLKENREAHFYTNDTDNKKINSTEEFDDHSDQETSNATENSYAVHENVDEDATTTEQPSTFPSLKSFMEADPPEFSSEELKKSLVPHENDSNANFEDASSKQSNEKEDSSKISHNSYFSDEESAEKQETKVKDQPDAESLEETSSKENESMEDRTFFHYPSSRPSSPADNYEDPKYADLGPRINKPAFFHPPFRFSSYSGMKTSSEEDSQEAEETGEKKEHVFPWYRDKKDENREKRNPYHGKSIGEYEYPWERRERLAREKSRKRESKRKWLSYEDQDDDTLPKKRRRNAYPRGRYRFWTRKEEDASEEDAPDNVELSSEHKPVKYSSRYNSKNFTLPAGVTSTSERPTEVEEISRSIKKILEVDSEKKASKKNNSSGEEKRPGKRLGISRGMINPEAVTLAPTRRGERKDFVKINGIINLLKDEGKKGHGYSNASIKNALENVVLHLAKENPSNAMNSTKESNSTGQLKKRRRRPLKNVVSLVQSTTKSAIEANRNRRRQKPTTPGTVTFTSSSTTSVPRVVKRRSRKFVKDARKNIVPEENKFSNSDGKDIEASTVGSRVLENSEVKENDEKKSQMDEELVKSAKNRTDQELQGTSFKEIGNLKNTTDQGVNGTNESSESISVKSEDESEEARKAETSKKLEETLSSVTNDDKRFDFKDDRIESLMDFVTPDDDTNDGDRYDDKSGNILKEEGFLPKSTVQLSEQGSREIISTVSWMSENYDF